MSANKKITASDLGLHLTLAQPSEASSEYFKWFLACLLFGKPVQQEVAKRAYFELIHDNITSPEAVLDAGWDKLVEMLDRGHYVRHDFSTATKLLDVSTGIKEEYGSFGQLVEGAGSREELEKRLQSFRGVGPKTVEIFLRDMEPVLGI
ncbi:uncharacterized protein PADG_03117 [Paracoccidioides brasiliensis Pb18]|uniref:HhH-GPD domain-containing protein n=1 Tax=Paracoccidioides brasiliensis (strain Pb18) TaxID=502780 RepID=C1G7G2_PARBD|nr:uncharacterized protein PADG_03117 [Paracoccidioides brasiliensis Pb18]EEH47019.1 hypothetical protein PADG_03117 [Paracoccidioides brasiliensis Pb18]ODH51454.1 hypothetical protein GX48_02320 [Paracoccidioides brasiliensis]